MTSITKTLSQILLAAVLAGCASWGQPPVKLGDTEAQAVAKLGQPTHRYQTGSERLLEYRHGPWGQTTYMARLGPDGRLLAYEQVLTNEKFASIAVNKANKQDVLHTVGAPSETSYLSLRDLEVWSYPYRESGVWNSIMHVHFDRNGIVREMLNTQDLRYDRDPQLFGRR